MRIYQLSDRIVSLLVAEAASDVEATAALNVARSVLGATSLRELRESASAYRESVSALQESGGPTLRS